MPSSQNISIYQKFNGKPLLRQVIPGIRFKNFTYSPDFKTITMSVLSSTFNQDNAEYGIIVDDDAFKNKKTGQPLLGIDDGFWKFKTGM